MRNVVVAGVNESVRDAAQRMADEGVGTIVVLDEYDRPRGMVTDRDIVVSCVAKGGDPNETKLLSIMSSPVSWVRESTPIEDALSQMAGHHARRLVVQADGEDRAVGVLALDDVLELLAEEFGAVGKLLSKQA